jgi:hypothetical protein
VPTDSAARGFTDRNVWRAYCGPATTTCCRVNRCSVIVPPINQGGLMRLMTIPTIALWSAALMGCAPPQPPSAASVAPPGTTQFRQVTSPKGTKYVVSIRNDAWRTPSSQLAAEDAPSDVNVGFTTLSKSAGPTVAAARTSGQCTPKRSTPDKETFNGVDREVAKTTVPKAPVETFASVATLRAHIAKQSDDFDMMDSGISTKFD